MPDNRCCGNASVVVNVEKRSSCGPVERAAARERTGRHSLVEQTASGESAAGESPARRHPVGICGKWESEHQAKGEALLPHLTQPVNIKQPHR